MNQNGSRLERWLRLKGNIDDEHVLAEACGMKGLSPHGILDAPKHRQVFF